MTFFFVLCNLIKICQIIWQKWVRFPYREKPDWDKRFWLRFYNVWSCTPYIFENGDRIVCINNQSRGRIQLNVMTTLPFFFVWFLVSKDNILQSEMYNRWKINISMQLKIQIRIMQYKKQVFSKYCPFQVLPALCFVIFNVWNYPRIWLLSEYSAGQKY